MAQLLVAHGHPAHPHPGVEKECKLFPGAFGFMVQAILGIFCFSTLVFKWRREKPRRALHVFSRDCSKQVFGGLTLHLWNILAAMLFAHGEVEKRLNGGKSPADECDWYFVNILVDTTVGVFVTYKLLRISERVFQYKSGHYQRSSGTANAAGGMGAMGAVGSSASGYTGGGIANTYETLMSSDTGDHAAATMAADNGEYAKQIFIWLGIVSVMKLFMVMFMLILGRHLEAASEILLAVFVYHEKVKLLVVMILTPAIMNTVQFWLSDTFLKAKTVGTIAGGSEEEKLAAT